MRLVTVSLVVSLTLFLFNRSEALSSDGGRTVYKDGDFMLQGLFPITYLDNGRCERVDIEDGLAWMVAMMYAVNDINNSGFLFRKTLGYRIDNTCFNIPTAMNHAITVVSEHRPNSICRAEKDACQGSDIFSAKKVLAVIGPAISWISIPVASLLGLYSIPQISYGSTSRILSDKSRYKSFLRTIPSDEFQAQAMADFVQFFHWNYVYLLASDDDYGKMGAASFKAAAKKKGLCISNDEYISFTAENSEQLIYNAMSNLKKENRAKVVIIFSYLYQGEKLLIEAKKQNVTDRTWITSDAWGTKTAKLNISKQLLNGIFTFGSATRRIPKLERYIRNLTVDSVKGNEWLENYLSQKLGCYIRREKILSLNLSSQRYCNLSENLPIGKTFNSMINENSGNVIDAVYATAHGIRDILTCKGKPNARNCMGTVSSVQPDALFKSIQHTTFKSAYGTPVKFDENGEKMFKEYTIRNLQITSSGAMRYVQIGNWVKDGQRVNFSVNTTLIAWNTGKRPVSTCFRECQPGEQVVGKSECCWNCQRCPKGSASSVQGADECIKCNETYYANEARTKCVLRKTIYLTYSDPAGISIITVSVFGLVLTSAIAAFIARLRETALVQDSSPLLMSVFILTLSISFLFSICYVIAKPSNNSCATLNSLFLLLQMFYAVFLLAKTRQANQWLRSAVSCIKMKVGMVYAQLISVCIFLLLQIILITLWQSTQPSVAHYIKEFDNARLLECNEEYSVLRILATVFPLIVLAAATLIAFKERNLPENHSEAKFISFASIALCIVVIAFFPTYRYVRGISKVLVVTFTSFIAAFSCMGCIFIPKIYVILFSAESDSLELHQNFTANSSMTLRELCSPTTENVHKSLDHLVDGHAGQLHKTKEAQKYDASLNVNGKTHSKLSLQERFNLETLNESDSSEHNCEPRSNEGVAENPTEAKSNIPKVETSKRTEVLSSNNLDSGVIATKEFLL